MFGLTGWLLVVSVKGQFCDDGTVHGGVKVPFMNMSSSFSISSLEPNMKENNCILK